MTKFDADYKEVKETYHHNGAIYYAYLILEKLPNNNFLVLRNWTSSKKEIITGTIVDYGFVMAQILRNEDIVVLDEDIYGDELVDWEDRIIYCNFWKLDAGVI